MLTHRGSVAVSALAVLLFACSGESTDRSLPDSVGTGGSVSGSGGRPGGPPSGNPVGRVLHVGTGAARLMVVIGEGCTGPRAYAGLAASYFERITENFVRLTDEEWKDSVYYEKSPAWLDDVVR